MNKNSRLSERQVRILLDYFDRSLDKETMESIASSHNITRKTLWSWKETKHGKELYAEWRKEKAEDAIPEFYEVLKVRALSGSYKHMELFAKIFGVLPTSTRIEISEQSQSKGANDTLTEEELIQLRKELLE